MIRETKMLLYICMILLAAQRGCQTSPVADIVPNVDDDDVSISLTPPPGIHNFLGVGYDIIDGNPEGGELHNGGVDPGLKTTFRVFDLTYDKGTEMYGYAIPDQVSYVDRQSSISTSSRDIFHGTQSYVQKLEKDSEIGGSARIIRGKFSKSKNYESVQAGVETHGMVYYEDKTVTLEAEARYNWELAEHELYPLDNGFVVEACSLPSSYHETSYMQFLQRRGTHVVTSLNLGMRTIERYEQETTGFVHFARESVEKSTSLRAGYRGYTASLAVDMDEFQANLQAGMTFGSKTYTFTSGSPDFHEPIHTGLHEMDEVFKEAYWTRFDDYLAAGLCDPSWIDSRESVAQNMVTALTGYAVWRNVHDAIDPSLIAIPITWPKGKYTLPKPTTGCPNAHFVFPEGYRYHDTEDKDSNNHWSSPSHLAGYKSKNNMEQWFCSKTSEEEDIYDWSFQPGKYCVMKKGSSCPAGLRDGSIYWDDEDNDNGNRYGGDMPSGGYGGNTQINYCCRVDGEPSVPIYLPTDNNFLLMKYNHQCQKVHGMRETGEYLRWDTEDRNNDDNAWGYHPYQGSGMVIEYCYYQPE